MKCRVYSCWLDAAEGSEFCRVRHGWQEIPPNEFAPTKAKQRRRPDVRVWTPELVVAAIQRWAVENGRQPKQADWGRRGEYYPSSSTAAKVCGSWGTALVAAGFVSHMGRPPAVKVAAS